MSRTNVGHVSNVPVSGAHVENVPHELLDGDEESDAVSTDIESAVVTLSSEPVRVVVEARAHGWRVDHYLSRLFPNYSRALFQRALEQKSVVLNGLAVKAARRLRVNDVLDVRLPELPDSSLPPEDIPLEVVFEDDVLVVINKPAQMITHPGKGHYRGTLAGALVSTVFGISIPLLHRAKRAPQIVVAPLHDGASLALSGAW